MAAIGLAAVLRAQEAALQSEGFVLKNCFIDEPPCGPSERPHARPHSAPPSPAARTGPTAPEPPPDNTSASIPVGAFAQFARLGSIPGSIPTTPPFRRRRHSDDCAIPTTALPFPPGGRGRRSDDGSGSAAGGSDGDGGHAGCSDDDGEPASGSDAIWSGCDELEQAILTKCGFLRISATRKSQGSLMFYVEGLPWARRAKWVEPLRQGVAGVLEGCGYRTHMSVGVLYVGDPEGSSMVRVSFAPAPA